MLDVSDLNLSHLILQELRDGSNSWNKQKEKSKKKKYFFFYKDQINKANTKITKQISLK